MARTDSNGGGVAGVSSVNGLVGAITLAAGANITLTPVGNTITIASPGGPGSDWHLIGNLGTNPALNFVGTTDAVDLFFRVNNLQSGFIKHLTASVGFGYRAGENEAGSNNAFFGASAGRVNGAAVNNAIFGAFAGVANTGDLNSFFGSGAGLNNSTGDNNTFIGAGSGAQNLTGVDNTFLGYNSGNNNLSNDNTFLGTSAGISNTSGSANTFVGSDAGGSNLTAANNTFVGYQAGYQATGTQNTAVGSVAGMALVGGQRNTLMGYGAGSALSAGNDNTLIGFASGINSVSASGNTALGSSALTNAIAAAAGNNTAIGANSLFNTTAQNNTAIGASAGAANAGGQQNTLVGALADTLGANNSNQTALGYSVSVDNRGTAIGSQTTAGDSGIALGWTASAVSNEFALPNSITNFKFQGDSYTLPTAFAGANGDVLSSTTLGVMSWITPSSGTIGGTIDVNEVGYGSALNTLTSDALFTRNAGTLQTLITAQVLGVGGRAIVDQTQGTLIWQSGAATWGFAADNFGGGNLTITANNRVWSWDNSGAYGAAGSVLTDVAGNGALTWVVPPAGTVTGSGAATRIAFWSAASVLSSDAEFQFLADRGVYLEDNTATHNTFLGADAGAASISGLSNVALGYRVGNALSSGDNNVMIGSGAGNLISTADGNVAIGNSAASTLTTGNNNVVIGNSAAVGAVGTTGAIALGASASAVTNQFALPDAITTWKFQGDSYTLPTAFPASNGDVLSSTTAGVMSWVSNGSVTSWSVVGVNTALAVNSGYITNGGGNINLTLPVTAAVGSVFEATADTAGGWTIVQNAGQRVRFGNQDTTIGVGGTLVSTAIGDTIRMVCTVADTDFRVLSSIGTLTVN